MSTPIAPTVISATSHPVDAHNALMGGHAGASMVITHGQSLGTPGMVMTAVLFTAFGLMVCALIYLAIKAHEFEKTNWMDWALMSLFALIALACFGLAGACIVAVV